MYDVKLSLKSVVGYGYTNFKSWYTIGIQWERDYPVFAATAKN